MALRALQPFCYDHFVGELGSSLQDLFEVVESQQEGGWKGLLERYHFGAANYVKGNNTRVIFHSHFLNASDRQSRTDVAKQILSWGRMPKLDEAMIKNMDNSLQLLNDDEVGEELHQLYARRISSMSKVYEMWNPDAFIIYDAYRVRGLQWIVSQYWGDTQEKSHESLLKFPWPKGRRGEKIEGFPVLSTPRQARLGFAYASWFCRSIAEQLNRKRPKRFPWRTFHIEMAAYQLGHEV